MSGLIDNLLSFNSLNNLMEREEIIKKITLKKEFSQLPKKDVELAFSHFERRQTSEEDKIKLARDLLRKTFFSFGSMKLLNREIINKKRVEDVLNKHISTKERAPFYKELYKKLVNRSGITVFDLGAGINGLSYNYFPKNTKYVAIESVGQLVDLMNYYFEKNKLKNAIAINKSLFELKEIEEIIKKQKGKKIIFLFKTIDSLEMTERNFSKKFLLEIVPLVDEVVVSFATESLIKRQKFKVERYWFENFVSKEFNLIEKFQLGSERYIVFKKR